MIWLIACIASFVLGTLHGQGKLIPWVRGAAGKARGVVFGSRPAPRDQVIPDAKMIAKVSPPPANKPINLAKLAGEAWKFVWHWRHFIVAGILFAIAWGFMHKVVSFVTCPFGGILWCASDNDDAALENERTNTRVAELEAQVGALSAQLAENSANDRRRVDHVIAEANQELAHAVEADDFEGAYSIYRRAYDGVWNDLEPTGEPDPAARGPDPLPSAIASPV